LHSHAEYTQVLEGMMAGVVGSLWLLLALAGAVAVFGIVNTLTMNVQEQTREIGLLRVVGTTRPQVRRLVLLQAWIMALIGIIPGTLAAIGVAYIINLCTLPLVGHEVEVALEPGLLTVGPLVAIGMVLLAAVLPARRAARIELSSALIYE
jgi:putative ABC transport system permease protein